VIVRRLRTADLPEIERIEQRAMTAPWSEAQLREEIEVPNGLAFAVTCDDQLWGYAFFRTCFPECELVHLIVAPEWRRRGAAATLLTYALTGFAAQDYATCFLEVRESNEAARGLYAQAGFLQTGSRKHYYSQPVESALLLTRDLAPAKERIDENTAGS
jgi:[ribosomal protein S18]-alanine N-acetyltransferase